VLDTLRNWWQYRQLPEAARKMAAQDHASPYAPDPGPVAVIGAVIDWLCRAQNHTASGDDGVARHYSLISGWATSYPETTGYIVPTLLRLAELHERNDLRVRARRMLDWLVAIQLADGGFQGGRIDAKPVVSVTFNTGQILLGLAAGVQAFGAYHEAMHRAARFLRDSLDDDGCWRSHPTPFAEVGEKAYETHVAWGLFEADRLAPGEGYGEAGMHQVRWAMTKQQANGWVADCCLNLPQTPLTHTLGYYLKGLAEAHRWSGDQTALDAAQQTASGLLGTQRPDGALPGRVYADWRPAADWSCLTGNVQVADSWFYLGQVTGDQVMIDAGRRANAYVRRTVILRGEEDVRGGVKGSFPVDGDYGRFELLNWAAKFTIDANLTEQSLTTS